MVIAVGGVWKLVADDLFDSLERKRSILRVLCPSGQVDAELGIFALEFSGRNDPPKAVEADRFLVFVESCTVSAIKSIASTAMLKLVVWVCFAAQGADFFHCWNHRESTD